MGNDNWKKVRDVLESPHIPGMGNRELWAIHNAPSILKESLSLLTLSSVQVISDTNILYILYGPAYYTIMNDEFTEFLRKAKGQEPLSIETVSMPYIYEWFVVNDISDFDSTVDNAAGWSTDSKKSCAYLVGEDLFW